MQSTCAKSQFSAAHKRSVIDERGGWGKVDRLHSSKINLVHTAKVECCFDIQKILIRSLKGGETDENASNLPLRNFFLMGMISLNFLKLICFLRSRARKDWIRAIPRTFGASNSCHCHGRRPHFGTCLASLWLRKPLFSQRGNFSLAPGIDPKTPPTGARLGDARRAKDP